MTKDYKLGSKVSHYYSVPKTFPDEAIKPDKTRIHLILHINKKDFDNNLSEVFNQIAKELTGNNQ